jgi:ABC-type nitrate/sulfonate/bicarbonate transport system ATPase subunit
MIENISLVLQVHEGLSRKTANERSFRALEALGLSHLAAWRYDICSEKEIFFVQLIRAHMQKDAKIVIDQPFAFLAEEMDLEFILTALDRLMISYEEVLIIDLTGQKSHYKETACHIEE